MELPVNSWSKLDFKNCYSLCLMTSFLSIGGSPCLTAHSIHELYTTAYELSPTKASIVLLVYCTSLGGQPKLTLFRIRQPQLVHIHTVNALSSICITVFVLHIRAYKVKLKPQPLCTSRSTQNGSDSWQRAVCYVATVSKCSQWNT